MRSWSRAGELVVVVALTASCGGRSSPGESSLDGAPRCVAGLQVACACLDGTDGVQRCRSDGTFDACSCGADGSGAGGSNAGGGPGQMGESGSTGQQPGMGGHAGALPDGRRLPVPCTAPLPTGYCFVSDQGDFIGGGESSQASGEGSVTPGFAVANDHLEFRLANSANGDEWRTAFVPPAGKTFVPGLYEPATRHPFQLDTVAGLSISGNGRGCNELSGKFAVEELEMNPTVGLVRASVTFEQRCESGQSALRGVINFQATGVPDETPEPTKTITLEGNIFRVVYDPVEDVAYGLDATSRRLARVELATGEAKYTDVVNVPSGACLDSERERLFVVNKGSNLITEYDTTDLSEVRDISWSGTDWQPSETHFEIHCSPDRLYVVDGAWTPALFTVEGLDGDEPVVADHTEQVAGVGGLVLNAAATDLYYWYQLGWSAGSLSSGVHRLKTSDLSEVDVTGDVADFSREPLDAPILLDESRDLIFSKNKIFEATNLSKIVYSLPSDVDTFDGAAENVYALDVERGLIATKNYVYELGRYDIVAPTLLPTADQLFFDASGGLWFLSTSKGQLVQQRP